MSFHYNQRWKIASRKHRMIDRWQKNFALLKKEPYKAISAFEVTEVSYLGLSPKRMFLSFESEKKVRVYSSAGEWIETRPVDDVFEYEGSSFRINVHPEELKTHIKYQVTLYPKEHALDRLLKNLSIKVRREDPSIIDLSYKDVNSQRGASVLNTLMRLYKTYLIEENTRIAEAQLDYLNARQEMLSDKIEDTLKEHVAYLQENLGEKGFIGLHQELELVESRKKEQSQRLLQIDLSLSKLHRIEKENLLCISEPSLGENVATFQDKLLGLKKRKDTLDLSNLTRLASFKKRSRKQARPFLKAKQASSSCLYLKEKSSRLSNELDSVSRQSALPIFSQITPGLLKLYQTKKECELRQGTYFGIKEKESELKAISAIRENIKRLLGDESQEKIQFEKASVDWTMCGFEKDPLEQTPSTLKTLLRFDNLLGLKQDILEKSLFYQEETPEEFSSLDLESAKQLHLGYTKQLDEAFLEEKTFEYALNNAMKHEFELTSLTSILKDPISCDILSRVAKASVEMQNDRYYSQKDKERLSFSIEKERVALTTHLKERLHLTHLHKQLLGRKIKALQSQMTQLVNQEIALIENQIHTSIQEKIQALNLEKAQIKSKLQTIYHEMKDLPKKWLLENKLQLKSDLNVSMMEAISQLVESKNVEHHLMQIESKPIDKAYAPLKPKETPIILLSVVGGIFGAILAMGLMVFQKVAKNLLPVSLEGLSFRDRDVAGVLSTNFDRQDFASLTTKDLQTLRRLIPFALGENTQVVGAALGKQYNYLSALAYLLGLSKRKTLLIEMFHQSKEQKSGLLHYLLGKNKELPIQKKGEVHLLSLGENTKYTMELLSRKKFELMLSDQLNNYEVILIGVAEGAASPEARKLMQLCQKMVITLDTETLDDLYPYFQWEEEQGKPSVMYLACE